MENKPREIRKLSVWIFLISAAILLALIALIFSSL